MSSCYPHEFSHNFIPLTDRLSPAAEAPIPAQRSGLNSLTPPRLIPAILLDLRLIGDLHGLILLRPQVLVLDALEH